MALMTNRYAGGETVREMQNISGCKINVQPPYGRDIEREIQLVGSRNAIEQAKIVIMNKITSVVRATPGLLSHQLTEAGTKEPCFWISP